MAILDLFKKRKKIFNKKRSFDGAGTGRLLADFKSIQQSADSELKTNLRTLRNRARQLARNNDYANRYLQLMRDNVVGSRGITLQNKARSDRINGFDTIANVVIEEGWRDWGFKQTCSADGKLTWLDAQNLFMETWARDGEVLIEIIETKPTPENKYGFSIRFLEADYLDEDYNEILNNGNSIRMGVEINSFGRPLAYHLCTTNPADTQFPNVRSKKYQRINANRLIHAYKINRPEATRGIPPMSVAMVDLQMLGKYMEAELVASRISASSMGVIKQSGDYVGDGVEDDYTPTISLEAGTFQKLDPNQEMTMFDPTHPTSQFETFTKTTLRSIASGLGVSYTSLANDLEGVSYSSIRQGALEERDYYKGMQKWMIDNFMGVVYKRWLQHSLTVGALQPFGANAPLPASKFDQFHRPRWQPRGWQWVDPQKESTAIAMQLNNGLITMQDALNFYGRDVQDHFEQITLEKQMADNMDIKTAFEPFGGGQSAFGSSKIDPFLDKSNEDFTEDENED